MGGAREEENEEEGGVNLLHQIQFYTFILF